MPRLAVAAPLALLLLSTAAAAAPPTFVEQRKNFMVFDDDGTVENANWFSREGFYAAYYPLEKGFLAVHPDDSQFIIVYSTFNLVEGVGAFFQSLANDVKGIGYDNAAELDPVIPAEIFDDTPDSQFVGMLHMNNWQFFLNKGTTDLNDEWISLVFGQELGHAWLAFPYIDQGNGPTDVMLGRSNAHWSFYLHTNGSPVEGHRWTDNMDGTFTAEKLSAYEFSDLDLYLMGLMDAKEVQPSFVIEDPHDCVDSQLPNMECPPASAHRFQAPSFTVSGTRRDITVDDVIAAHGERVPAFPDAPNKFELSFLLLKRPDETLCDDQYALIDAIIDRSMMMWVGQTRGRATLVNRTRFDGPIAPNPDCIAGSTGDPGGSTGAPDPTTGGDDPTTGQAGSSGQAGSTGADTGAASGTGGATDTSGCACQADPKDSSAALLLLGLAGLRRRRPRASHVQHP